jgi:hypothetical protein
MQIDGLYPLTNYSISLHTNLLSSDFGSPETAPVVFSTKPDVGAPILNFTVANIDEVAGLLLSL